MAASVAQAKAARDRIHNLDFSVPEHRIIFEQVARDFLIQNEVKWNGVSTLNLKKLAGRSYHDTSKIGPNGGPCQTVGIGFNMDATSAKKEWGEAFKGKISFQDVYDKKRVLEDHEIETLFQYSRAVRLKAIEEHFGEVWQKLKPNERLAIESAYYTGPSIVTKKNGVETQFSRNIQKYVETREQKYLENAVFEIEKRSNKGDDKGIQNRRDAEAAMLSSYQCPMYSKPGEPPIPRNRKIPVVLGRTILPRDSDAEDFKRFIRCGKMPALPFLEKNKSDNYSIWRTKNDGKVRSTHVENEGKVFDRRFPPPTGNPGEGFNCRCEADSWIPIFACLLSSEFSK